MVDSRDLGPKIRCFVIADDYRWHFITDSIEEFREKTKEYLELMTISQKENQYHFRNIFLSPTEYEVTIKNFYSKSAAPLKVKNKDDKKGPNLYLIE